MTQRLEVGRSPGWDRVAWVFLGAMAAVTRLPGLGDRLLSYDEGVHAFFSWRLAETGAYFHSPVTHGPVLFYLDALLFRLVGASDYTARLMPALAGVGLVLLPLLFRRWIGRAGSLATGFLLACSPLLLFYSRYLRNDIYIALLCTLWTWACFRYLERRAPAALYLLVIVSSLAVTTKEVAFIFAAVLTLWLAWTSLRSVPLRESAAALAVLHITLFLPFASPLVLVLPGLGTLADRVRSSPEAAVGCVALSGLVATSLAFAWSRRRLDATALDFSLWIRLASLGWGIEALYFSTFMKNPAGLVSGFFGSVDYWLGQQPVGRGGQPWFYYLMLVVLYEFLPLLLALVSVVLRSRSGWPGLDSGRRDGTSGLQDRFWWFCLYWLGASLVAYSLAGEKMPWLTVHIVLPLCWLAGDGLQRLLRALPRPFVRDAGLLAVPALLFVAWISFLRAGAEISGAIDRARANAGRLGTFVSILAVILVIVRVWPRCRSPRRILLMGIVILGAAVWLRTGWMLNFVHQESPSEFAVFAHADPGLRELLVRLEALEPATVVRVTSSAAYPVRWYMRKRQQADEVKSLSEALGDDARVIITQAPLTDQEERMLKGRSFEVRKYPYLSWPAAGYKALGWKSLFRRLPGRSLLPGLWNAFYERDCRGLPGFSHPPTQSVLLLVRTAETGDPSTRAPGGEMP